jgi:hypothetical protein
MEEDAFSAAQPYLVKNIYGSTSKLGMVPNDINAPVVPNLSTGQTTYEDMNKKSIMEEEEATRSASYIFVGPYYDFLEPPLSLPYIVEEKGVVARKHPWTFIFDGEGPFYWGFCNAQTTRRIEGDIHHVSFKVCQLSYPSILYRNANEYGKSCSRFPP